MSRLRLAPWALLGSAGAALCLAAAAAPPATPEPDSAAMEALVELGFDEPDKALDALRRAGQQGTDARTVARSTGLVAAASARSDALQAALVALAALAPDPMAAADAALVRAAAADLRGETPAALAAAQAARQGYEAACDGRADCAAEGRWRARMLLARHEGRRGLHSAALGHALAAVEVARAAAHQPRTALALARAASLHSELGDAAAAKATLAEALALAREDGGPLLRARVALHDARMRRHAGDTESARRVTREGLALARQGGSRRLEALHLGNLADLLLAAGQPRAALRAIDAALPAARLHGDARVEQLLQHNAGLARIALGQGAEARQAIDGVLEAYRARGATAEHVAALREFGDAYAAAGDLRAALQLFHRERQLAAELMTASRDAALAELRLRYDRTAQQRRLEQLGLEQTLVDAELAQRAVLRQVWAAGALVLLLAGAAVALMYRRVREIHRSLAGNQQALRERSQRDPLTGLLNRRGLHEAVAASGQQQAFAGTLLLVDIDHFKHINDRHGHACGDAVLTALARRLDACAGPGAMVVRWGGEEFLVALPAGDGAAGSPQVQARALAARVLQAVGAEPVALPGGTALRVTASLGYAAFPLPPARLPLPLETVVNLVDMALYTAKNQGRNCAVGIVEAAAADRAALRRVEADFDLARSEGAVTIERLPGPVANADGAAAPAAPQPAGDELPA